MEYYFVADFGSANSGCAYMENTQTERPYILHSRKSDPSHYAKEDTCFAITKDFLDELIENFYCVDDTDFRIKSDSDGLCHTESPNVVWRQDALSEINPKEYVIFSHFKMHLYENHSEITGSNNVRYNVQDIIKIFLRILKIDALITFQTTARYRLQPSDIVHWGLTIPAIWSKTGNEGIMEAMKECATEVFGEDCIMLWEPQGALTFFQYYAITGSSNFRNGRVSIVVDAGGGTTDLACIVEEYAGGEPKYNSVMLPNGVGHAGNEIDRDFWIELADLLVKGSGTKQYENEDKCDTLISKYIDSSYQGKCDFYNSWRRVQADCYEKHLDNLTFRFNKDYLFWLNANGHREIARYLQEEFNEVDINKDIVEECHSYVIKEKIIPSIKNFINEVERRYKVDRIILAGGLSYTNPFEQEIRTLAREKGINEIASCGNIANASGAVMLGAVAQLKNPELITNTAVKSIFYNILVPENEYIYFCMEHYDERFNLSSLLFSDNKPEKARDFFVQTIKKKIESEKPYREFSDRDDGVNYIRVLSPICIKGCLADDFKDTLSPSTIGQTSVTFNFYSSDEQICVYSSNPNLHLLKSVNVDLGYYGDFEVEIKFNAGQMGNPIIFTVKDRNGNILKEEEFENLFKKGC